VPRDAKRERILAAATAVFAERDFHRVQVSEVAERAGVGKGTVYLYFPSKDDLHQAALEGSLQRLAADVDQAAAADAPAGETLRQIVLCILRFFWKRQHLLTLVQRYERRGGRGPRERRHRVLKAVGTVLAKHRLGANGDAAHLDAAFLLGLSRAAILEHAPADKPDDVAERIVRLYLHGVDATTRAPARAARRSA
jgi:AcrR family transcriptional regulator